jgi:hypothetical protein
LCGIIILDLCTLIFSGNSKTIELTAKAILSKNSNSRGVPILNFKLHYRVKAIKNRMDWHKNRHEDLWNKI